MVNNNIYKLLAGIMMTILLMVVFPMLASKLGWMDPLADKAPLILMVATLGLVIKSLIGDVVAGEFLFYKFGYDNCVLTFGSILTAFSLQLTSSVDHFPSLDNIAIIKHMTFFATEPISQRLCQFFSLLLISLVSMILTGKLAAALKHDNPDGKYFLSFISSVLGAALLGVYVLVLITKE
ncbi:hypothetical protein ACJO11_23945 [Vibrio parahaemolyticus]|uniref:hypothetical protein n=1 Tax=Vibrio parahaemolyticus TaxID=670 RepID=UPI00111CD0C2|nr:hypothetical protein [Vibrio parahaemolyticus]MBE4746387.1 hypothetical protein [Vibrio parahaemolyticus]MCZ5940887.1 hypothetical protein [Vibrio parahaemolyticus]TOF19538.1 hypothetical protein CGJ27_24900 [Vibrio parahaemolyticus]HBC3960245.1 hypothetical protein [Vibrio parahaemolyticus]HCD5150590.1 hypothetical protein [Vibrio parahaemolyticus]